MPKPRTVPRNCIDCGKPSKSPRGYRRTGLCHQCATRKAGIARRQRIEVVCEYCDKQYELRPKESETRARFCSSECYHASTKGVKKKTTVDIQKICKGCNTSFQVPKSGRKQEYCSKRCAYNARSKPMPECIDCGKQLKRMNSLRCMSCAGKARKPRQKPLTLNCSQCGKPSKKGYHGKHGLCRKCAAPLVGLNRRRRIALICPICQKEFEVQWNIARRNNDTLCSKECFDEWKKTFRVGKQNYGWHGGKNYYGPNWQSQRRHCRKRDDYKCQECGKTQKENGKALDVHHIVPFKSFGYIPDENDNYLFANDLSNLVALCRACHILIEKSIIPSLAQSRP